MWPHSSTRQMHMRLLRRAEVRQKLSTDARSAAPRQVYENPPVAVLPRAERERLVAMQPRRVVQAGTYLMCEGDYGDCCSIVLNGELVATRGADTSLEQQLAVHGPGAPIGEMALLHSDQLRTASIVARTEATLLEITREDFEALMGRYPILAFTEPRQLREGGSAAREPWRSTSTRSRSERTGVPGVEGRQDTRIVQDHSESPHLTTRPGSQKGGGNAGHSARWPHALHRGVQRCVQHIDTLWIGQDAHTEDRKEH
jgi:CRP-like cAMP-binding protein